MLSNLLPKLAEPLRWIIVLAIFATLAQTVLFFAAPPAPAAGETATPAASRPAQREPVSINAILTRNLFGVAGARTEVVEQVATVETRLPLELRGVFVGDLPEDSAAIVAQKGRSEELYLVGEMLPGNAELAQVHPDHIVLRRAGNLETLRFPEGGGDTIVANKPDRGRSLAPGGRGVPSASRSRPGQGAIGGNDLESGMLPGDDIASTPRELIDSYRDKLEQDPDGALTELGLAPVNPDGSGGYRLGDLARSPYLSQTGLQPGDVVLSVNGEPVGNIRQDRQQLDAVLQQGAAKLEVQRGTRRFFVTASLK